jgi:hypothetical protein
MIILEVGIRLGRIWVDNSNIFGELICRTALGEDYVCEESLGGE